MTTTATTIKYADQSARALQFYLLAGPVDVNALTVLRELHRDWNGNRVRIGILGASHFISLTTKSGRVFNEVFACAKLDVEPSVRSGPLGSLQANVVTKLDGLRYTFTPRLTSWGEGHAELQKLADRVVGVCQAGEVGTTFAFPGVEGDARIPSTLIHASFKRSEFSVWTAHSYPSEEEIVFTKTTIQEVW